MPRAVVTSSFSSLLCALFAMRRDNSASLSSISYVEANATLYQSVSNYIKAYVTFITAIARCIIFAKITEYFVHNFITAWICSGNCFKIILFECFMFTSCCIILPFYTIGGISIFTESLMTKRHLRRKLQCRK